MKRILEVLTAALTFLFSQKTHVTELRRQVEERDKVIVDLKKALEDENADDETREAALEAANTRIGELETELSGLADNLDAAKIQAEALAREISEDETIPMTISENGVFGAAPTPLPKASSLPVNQGTIEAGGAPGTTQPEQ